MNIIFFSHPSFLKLKSMDRYAEMLTESMKKRGHEVQVWSPQPKFFNLPSGMKIKKWLGYIDQYLIFPIQIKRRLKNCSPNTLFVFTDHALGPWIPMVAHRLHIIHCHDFLAQRSALNEIPENPTSLTGRLYQKLIRYGYSKGKHFISVSNKTKVDLHQIIHSVPATSKVVYNGLNERFKPHNIEDARTLFSDRIGLNISQGYILHVGGNQWYKNRTGVIAIYNAWRSSNKSNIPLLLIGEKPSQQLIDLKAKSPFTSDIHFLSNIDDKFVGLAYAAASVFLFPSLAEGFGWPIAEAMAAGCPVITTGEPPMTEVAGNAGFLISRQPIKDDQIEKWAINVAKVITQILNLSLDERASIVRAGLANVERFNSEKMLDEIEKIYLNVVKGGDNSNSFLSGGNRHKKI